MASKTKLINQITAIAKDKGVDVPETEDKDHTQLSAILKGLKTPPAAPVAPVAPEANDDDDTPPEANDDDDTPPEANDDDDTPPEANDDDDTPPPAPAPKAKSSKPKKVKRPPYYMAENKSITSKKGSLSDGDEVKVEYLGGGKSALEAHVKAGNVIKRG